MKKDLEFGKLKKTNFFKYSGQTNQFFMKIRFNSFNPTFVSIFSVFESPIRQITRYTGAAEFTAIPHDLRDFVQMTIIKKKETPV